MKYFYGIIRHPWPGMPLGVRAVWIENGKTMSVELTDITNKVKELSNFVEALNRSSVDVCHLQELTEDFLAKIYSPEEAFPTKKNHTLQSKQGSYHACNCFCEDARTEEPSSSSRESFSPPVTDMAGIEY